MRKFILAAVAATAFASTAAWAAVTYDPASGGFVGKGDVQLAFGWNNADFQNKSQAVTFTYEDETVYESLCSWTTGRKLHTNLVTVSSGINATLRWDQRKKNQLLGWDLGPAGDGTANDAEIPVEGGTCDAEGENAQGTFGPVTSYSTGSGGLVAHHGGESRDMPNTL